MFAILPMRRMKHQIERTKVPLVRASPPRHGVDIVRRARLESLAERVAHLPVTLVVAAGGYGKTTLLLTWMDALARGACTSWLTLVPEEISLTEIVEGIVLACARAFPDFGGSVRNLLERRIADPLVYATTIGNELYVVTEDHAHDLVLFLDDAHAVVGDAESTAFLSGLLQRLPPRVHVVLASRRVLSFSPLAKLRNAGQLLELKEPDLRFRVDEAQALYGDHASAEVAIARTEGWPIAIHLTAALAHERKIALSEALPAAGEAVFPFLAEEVVSLLEPDLRELLGPLAILATLDAATINHVLERGDGAAIVARLADRSLYVSQTADGSWRFHHLFREFLIRRLTIENPERAREVRRRYAALLRGRGEKLAGLEQVIETGDLAEIVEYVQEAIVTIRFTAGYRRLLDLFVQFPEEVKRRKPMLYRLHASALQRAGRWDEADAQLQACYEAARANHDDGTACISLIERGIAMGSFRFRMHGDHERSERCFQEALTLAEGPSLRDHHGYRKLACEVLGLVSALRFDHEAALTWLAEAERLELSAQTHAELVLVEIARVHAWMGNWSRALEYAEVAEEFFRADYPFHVGYALLMQVNALVALAEEPERAVSICREAIESLRSSYEDEELGVAYAALAQALLALESPDLAAVAEACDLAERFLDAHNGVARCEVAMIRARAAAAVNDAAAWSASVRRAERLSQGDAWLAARVDLLQAQRTQQLGEDPSALVMFEACVAAFHKIGDKYHRALARVGAACSKARLSTLAAPEVRDLFDELSSTQVTHVLRHDERASRILLYWCMRHSVEVRVAESMLETMVFAWDDELARIARDGEVNPPGRAAALRLIVARAGLEAYPLLRELSTDTNSVVAASATALLDTLPADVFPAMRIEVVEGLTVSLGGDLLQAGDPRWGRKKAAELLRLLAISAAPLTKSAVMSALWPESETISDVTLRVVIHALRRALQPGSEGRDDYISFDGSTVALQRARVESVDATQALSNVQLGKHHASLGEYQEAQTLLDAAVSILVKTPKDATEPMWMQPHLRRWREAAIDALHVLAAIHRDAKRLDAALADTRQALALDVLDETSVCIAIELYTETGAFEDGGALYASYKRKLADTIGTTPSAEVIERYSRLLARRAEGKKSELSTRELEILRMISQGETSKEIAAALNLSPFTVNNHVGRILRKLGVDSRAAAVAQLQSIEGFAS